MNQIYGKCKRCGGNLTVHHNCFEDNLKFDEMLFKDEIDTLININKEDEMKPCVNKDCIENSTVNIRGCTCYSNVKYCDIYKRLYPDKSDTELADDRVDEYINKKVYGNKPDLMKLLDATFYTTGLGLWVNVNNTKLKELLQELVDRVVHLQKES